MTGLKIDLVRGSSDTMEASALGYKQNYIHIYSNSWGPQDNGFEVASPGKLVDSVFKQGVMQVNGHLHYVQGVFVTNLIIYLFIAISKIRFD